MTDGILEENRLQVFIGYAFYLLNSDDGNIYVLSLGDDTETNHTIVTFIPKEEMNGDKLVLGWTDDLEVILRTLVEASVSIPPEIVGKLCEVLPIKVKSERDITTGKTIITILEQE